MKVRAKIVRVLQEDDGKTQKTVIALGAPDGAPPFTGAVSVGAGQGTVAGAFAVFEIDQADVSRFKGGTEITLTLAED